MRSRRGVLKDARRSLLTATVGYSYGSVGHSRRARRELAAGAACGGTRDPGWTAETAMPAAQSNMASGVIDGTLYCVGGIRSDRYLDATARGFRYDPADGDGGSWTRLPDLPTPLWGQCGVSDGDRLFAFGGAPADSPYYTDTPPTDEIFVFEPGDGWTNLSETECVRCPYPTWVMQGVYNPRDGLIYNVGGAVYQDGYYGDESDWVWTFDPETREVVDAPLTTLPTKRRWSTVGLVDVDGRPMLHVMAGEGDQPLQNNDRYDLDADEWWQAAQVPAPGIYAANSDPVIHNRIYLTHGLVWYPGEELANDSYIRACWEYDPVTDEWTTDLDTPSQRRSGAAAGVINGTLFLAGGHRKHYDTDNYHEATTHVESFTP